MTEQELLSLDLEVYDMKKLMLALSDGKYIPHMQNELAVIKDPATDKWVTADYEAIGGTFENRDKSNSYFFELEKADHPGSISIFREATCELDFDDFDKHKECVRIVKASDFFEKREYNNRCRWNWSELLDAVATYKYLPNRIEVSTKNLPGAPTVEDAVRDYLEDKYDFKVKELYVEEWDQVTNIVKVSNIIWEK